MRGSGGTDGGVGMFFIGLGLAVLAVYLFFDSVRVTTEIGLISGFFGARAGGLGQTTSMGLIFIPALIAVIGLFYDARRRWAWWLLYLGIAIIGIEILSHIRFYLNAKLTHLMGMLVLFGAGIGLMLRSLAEHGRRS